MELTMNKIAESIALKFLNNNNIELNREIAKVASENKLNPFEIDRIINHANKKIIIGIQKNINSGTDPHFTFPRAEREEVLRLTRKRPVVESCEAVLTSPDEKIMSPFYSKNDLVANSDDVVAPADIQYVISALEMKAGLSQSKLSRLRMMISDLKSKFEKVAFQFIINGGPIEPIMEIDEPFGVVDGIVEHMKNNLIKVASVGSMDFDLNPSHPLSVLYIDMHKLRMEEEILEKNASEDMEKLNNFKKRSK
jgi:hypothetical protein